MEKIQCAFNASYPDYIRYHDEEWGRPSFDDRYLFEMLSLEGAQAGLNWWTILKRRDNYRRAFVDFDIDRVARFTEDDVDRLMQDEGIIRHRKKIESVIKNARVVKAIRADGQSFSDYLWDLVGGQVHDNYPQTIEDIPSQTALSEKMSRQMKADGFRFVGPVSLYAFMQAVGMVNDHLMTCPVRAEIEAER